MSWRGGSWKGHESGQAVFFFLAASPLVLARFAREFRCPWLRRSCARLNQAVMLRRLVAATHRLVYWRIYVKIYVSATEFCRRNKSQKFCLAGLIFFVHVAAANFCCGDKDFYKNSPVHPKRLMLLRRVAATCCCNLSDLSPLERFKALVKDVNIPNFLRL